MDTSIDYAPIAIFVYNRLEHTRNLIDSLRKNPESKCSELFIFSDAPQIKGNDLEDKKNAEMVKSVRDYIDTIVGFKCVTIIKRDNNYGLAKNITTGVGNILESHTSVIVLEDDLQVSKAFLCYMNKALEKYKESRNVYSISGYSFINNYDNRSSENITYFLPIICSWAWATWRDKWKVYDESATGWETLKTNKITRYEFNFFGSIDYYSMLKSQMEKNINSWAIRWYWAVFKEKGLTLYPLDSYVANRGFDGSGEHTRGNIPGGSCRVLNDSTDMVFPSECEVDLKMSWRTWKSLRKKWRVRIKNKFIYLSKRILDRK